MQARNNSILLNPNFRKQPKTLSWSPICESMRYRSKEKDVLSGLEDETKQFKNPRLPNLSSMKMQRISTMDSQNLSTIPLDAPQSTANDISITEKQTTIYSPEPAVAATNGVLSNHTQKVKLLNEDSGCNLTHILKEAEVL